MLKKLTPYLTTLALLLAISFWLEYITVQSLVGIFTPVILFGTLALAGGLFLLNREVTLPRWVIWLTVGAALLRLFAGAAWASFLIDYGYDTEVQQAGYIMEDAFQRDRVAWNLAQKDESLLTAFTGYRGADQYGGLLALSAGVYRYLGGQTHQPMMMVVVTAAFSALATAFTWALARTWFDDQVALWAAWGVALFPEAVLLGSSQMREGYLLTFTVMAVYGLTRYSQTRQWQSLGWAALPLAAGFLFNPPLTMMSIATLVVLGLALDNWRVVRNWKLWAVLIGILILILVLIFVFWDQVSGGMPIEYDSPFVALKRWIAFSAEWQAQLTYQSSGWVQKTVRRTPAWVHTPFLLGYGISRPLLPSALLAWSAPLWRFVGIWRSVGWTMTLPILLFAPFQIARIKEKRSLLFGITLIVWSMIIVAALWGGSDQWDNPRYRVTTSFLQMILAAWVIVSQLRQPSPWMKRVLVGMFAIVFWLGLWYLRRYTIFDQIFGWTMIDLFKVLGMGVVSAVLYGVWDWMGTGKRKQEARKKR